MTSIENRAGILKLTDPNLYTWIAYTERAVVFKTLSEKVAKEATSPFGHHIANVLFETAGQFQRKAQEIVDLEEDEG